MALVVPLVLPACVGGGGRTGEIVENRAARRAVSRAADRFLAFVVGEGLLRANSEADLTWRRVGDLGDEVILHLAVHPVAAAVLYAITVNGRTGAQSISASRDGGRSWAKVGA